MPPPLRVLLAPDKFKGTLTADEVAAAMAAGVVQAFPDCDVETFPIADGGEGTVELALRHGFQPVTAQVTGPLGGPVDAVYARRGEVAVVEMAAASGLALLDGPPTPSSAASATSLGVGDLVAHAVRNSARRAVVGVGGSASTDGGAGALTALGARVLGADGRPVPPGGAGLVEAEHLDLTEAFRTVDGVELVVACDVGAVLCGPDGAAAVFGPQKGADAVTVERLDQALAHWADLVAATTGVDRREHPGSGAAGGAAFGLQAVGGSIASGVDLLLDLAGFDDLVRSSDLVLVGEGSLDAQSLLGKGPVGVARRAAGLGVPTVAVVGRSLVTPEQAHAAGLAGVLSVSTEVGEQRSLGDPAAAIAEVVATRLPSVWPGGRDT